MTENEYKDLSRKEFSKAAKVYETDDGGIYKMCRKDYPDILEELEKEEFTDLLDCGCGPAPMLTLLHKKYPEKHYTGIDLTPEMIEVAKAKGMEGVELVVGDCEKLPFPKESFDVVICSQSFHHYPNVQDFFNSVYRVLRPGGRLILRDMTMNTAIARWFCNYIEIPIVNLTGHGDVHVYGREEVKRLCNNAGLVMELFEKRGFCRLHCVARKPVSSGDYINSERNTDGETEGDRIRSAYHASKNIYDDVLTQGSIFSRMYIRFFWSGTDDNEIARKILSYIPDDFSGELLDVPVGTAVFTERKWRSLPKAKITCLDYSNDMLAKARERLDDCRNITFVQGDVGQLPMDDESCDIVMSMNGFHAFPDKKKAFKETWRVLKKGGSFIACFYIKGKSKRTDWLVHRILSKKGWFTPPFPTEEQLLKILRKLYTEVDHQVDGSMVYFKCIK